MKYGEMLSRVNILISHMIQTMISQVRMEQSFVACEHADAGVSLLKDSKVQAGQVDEYEWDVAWLCLGGNQKKKIFRVRHGQLRVR